jgi:hypothetical protein
MVKVINHLTFNLGLSLHYLLKNPRRQTGVPYILATKCFGSIGSLTDMLSGFACQD